MTNIYFLLSNKGKAFNDFFWDAAIDLKINDTYFLDFIKVNSGFYFDSSLVIYPFLESETYPSFYTVNATLNLIYGKLFTNLISFGQDVFGNQFCFETGSKRVVFFNIEDASTAPIAANFKGWIDVFCDDYNYYSGHSYLKEWLLANELKDDERLSPKIPFIIGGEYRIQNFYRSKFPSFLSFNADLAKQVHDLPDGTAVTLKVTR